MRLMLLTEFGLMLYALVLLILAVRGLALLAFGEKIKLAYFYAAPLWPLALFTKRGREALLAN